VTRQIAYKDVVFALRAYRASMKAMDIDIPADEAKRLEDFEIFVTATGGVLEVPDA
jgi:hypothetical protein